MITAKKSTTTGSNRGGYSYMELMAELTLVDPEAKWMSDAACRGMDFSVFFPDQGRSDAARMAKDVCKSCLVKDRCLEFANNNGIMYGIWGGVSVTERKRSGKVRTIR